MRQVREDREPVRASLLEPLEPRLLLSGGGPAYVLKIMPMDYRAIGGYVTDINESGIAAASVDLLGAEVGDSGMRPYVWDTSNDWDMPALLPTPGQGYAKAINESGLVAGFTGRPGDWSAVIWAAADAPTVLGKLTGYDEARLEAINDDGIAVGNTFASNLGLAGPPIIGDATSGLHPLYNPSDPGYFGLFLSTEVKDISNTGLVIGTGLDGFSVQHAFAYAWQDGLVTELPSPTGVSASAKGVNDAGDVIVGSVGLEAARWTWQPAGWQLELLGTMGGTQAEAMDVNSYGAIVGTSDHGGFLWRGGQAYHLPELLPTGLEARYPGLEVTYYPETIADNGTIVGSQYLVFEGNASYHPFAATSPPDSPPVANDDSAAVLEDGTGNVIDVLTNDEDPDGDSLMVIGVSPASHGTASLVDGAVIYTPDEDYFGTDEFTYTISDAQLTSNAATVTVTVSPVNDAPSFVAGSNVTVAEDAGPQSLAWATGVLPGPANEGDQLVWFAVSNDNAALFSTEPTIGPGGALTFAPALNASGQAVVTVTLHDDGGTADGGQDASASQSFTITVQAVADSPVLAVEDAAGDEDAPIPLDIQASVTDTDGSESLSVVIAGVPTGATLSAGADNGDGSWRLAAEELSGLTITPPPDSDAAFTLTVTAVATESHNGSKASTSLPLQVVVNNLVDLSGRVFEDRDNDGVFDPDDGDTPLAGVSVELRDQAGDSLIAAQTTAADGTYRFDANLGAGTYAIVAARPDGYLDGKETAGTIGGTVDNTQDSDAITSIVVGDPGTTADGTGYDFAELLPASLRGLVWDDFNDDGEVNLGELAIEGAEVRVTGTDDRGASVDLLQATDAQGIFEFTDLRPGTYAITETQPAGFVDGTETLGEVIEPTPAVILGQDGTIAGNDAFADVLLVADSSGVNYNFGERVDGGQMSEGQAAGTAFWQNKHGQAVIRSLNGSASSTVLGNWLAATFPNMYGSLAGMTNAQVADVYKQIFKGKGKSKDFPGGPPKLDAQVLAVALATYLTREGLAGLQYDSSTGDVVHDAEGTVVLSPSLIQGVGSYGFVVTAGGVGSAFFNVGDSGEAFGVADGSSVQVIDLLLATNRMSLNGLLYDDADGDGVDNHIIDSLEETLRRLANEVYVDINGAGAI